ncbi:hypothetical protein CLG85_010390 [Yangia mangrovi]|uniref:Uncharacterized protein n=1 Tax=Alloyangia mangrovi TaxID=1779329 RepID=A0A2A3JVW1_9RHOB|nr:hypothetical protein [Alloyangia mangrovi]MCA0939532.1 hypothetical protein [Alloyangia pacifica]MCA0943446.1 hypothetical protein [Alloyangia pacifica]MCT4370706.1 hypothetical protein [Alloyangia mangrovi]
MQRLALALALALVAAPAFAFHCPADMSKIDAALDAGPKLSEADLARVRQLRAEGERLHAAGQHQQSVDTLAEALRILGIK